MQNIQGNKKWLVIAEKPSVAADLAKALGKAEKHKDYYELPQYIITWAVGHLLEFLEPEEIDPKYKRWLLQDLPIIPERFLYKPKKNQEERLKVIKKLADDANVVGFINACDAGREGELIFREIYEYCDIKKPMQRLWLQSMTADAIREEFGRLRDGAQFDNLGNAARCRAESDWLIGMNATRAMTRRFVTRAQRGDVWSIGRVQTPTLALLVKREREILKHRPEPYWTLKGFFAASDHEYEGTWFDPLFKKKTQENEDDECLREKDDRIFDAAILQKILEELALHKNAAQATESRKESKEIAPQLFDLTSLQREANRKFGFSASRTLQSLQRLYERYKLVTYPRTDSRYLPEDYKAVVISTLHKLKSGNNASAAVIDRVITSGLLNHDRVFNDKGISDHFAIIPTGETPEQKLEGDDARIYDLVVKRFVAAFMPPAVWAKVERVTLVGTQHFRTRKQTLHEPGWREVYGLDSETEATHLPALTNPSVVGKDFVSEQSFTRPLPRYSEAKLLSLMEHCGKDLENDAMADALADKGIGTPATRAEIIENLIAKEYVVRIGRYLKPTTKGMRLVDILERIPVALLASVELTGEMEYSLKLMEKGQKDRQSFMQQIISFTAEIVDKLKTFQYEELYKSNTSLGLCPLCKTGSIFEGFWNYKCGNENCGYVIWKEKNQRYIDSLLVSEVLQGKKVGPLEFFSLSGQPFMAWVGVSQEGLAFYDEEGNLLETSTPSGSPITGEGVGLNSVLQTFKLEKTYLGYSAVVSETETAWICEYDVNTEPLSASTKTSAKKTKKLQSRMPKDLCGHKVTREEFETYIVTGTFPPCYDFKSKKGRTFAASLHMKKDGSFEFRFVSKKSKDNGVQESEASQTTQIRRKGK